MEPTLLQLIELSTALLPARAVRSCRWFALDWFPGPPNTTAGLAGLNSKNEHVFVLAKPCEDPLGWCAWFRLKEPLRAFGVRRIFREYGR